jgi:uncharacterized protein (DUF2267 family)
MLLDFEFYAAKGNAFVRLVADELDAPRARSGRVIRSVLHALRNRLTHEESFRLLAQLPLVLKGVYVDGWNFNKDNNPISHINDFLHEVMKVDGELAACDFGDYENEQSAVAAVFRVLSCFISEQEMENVLNVLPVELHTFIKDSIVYKETRVLAI